VRDRRVKGGTGGGMGCPVATSVESLTAGGTGGGMGCPVATSVESLTTGGTGGGMGCPVAESTEVSRVFKVVVALTELITGSTISSDRASNTKA